MANDVIIILVISVIFIGLGSALPFIQEDLNITPVTDNNPDDLIEDLGSEADQASAISVFTVIFSVFKMFFFTFGDIPFFLDVFVFIPIRVAFVFLIARNIWPGGGA